MLELINVPPIAQGAIVVAAITILAVGLYAGYAVVERFVGNRMLEALDDV